MLFVFSLFLPFSRGHTEVRTRTPPAGQPARCMVTAKLMETKKDVGVMSLSGTYPNTQAFALPLSKDKQRKACPRRSFYICSHYGIRPL